MRLESGKVASCSRIFSVSAFCLQASMDPVDLRWGGEAEWTPLGDYEMVLAAPTEVGNFPLLLTSTVSLTLLFVGVGPRSPG